MIRLLRAASIAIALNAASVGVAYAQKPNAKFRVEPVAINDAFVTRFFKFRTPSLDQKVIEQEILQLCPQRIWSSKTCIKQMHYVNSLLEGWNAKTNSYEDPYTKATVELAAATAQRATAAAGAADEPTKMLLETLDIKIKYANSKLANFPRPIPADHLVSMKKQTDAIKLWHSKIN
jgi:hypothetical protein